MKTTMACALLVCVGPTLLDFEMNGRNLCTQVLYHFAAQNLETVLLHIIAVSFLASTRLRTLHRFLAHLSSK